MSPRVARVLLGRLGVTEQEAKALGEAMMASIQSQKETDEVVVAD